MQKILIVVDIQNGFTRYEQTQILAKKIAELTQSKIFDKVIATRFRNQEGSQYVKFMNWHRLMDSPDIDLVTGIEADEVVDKWSLYTCITPVFMRLLKKLNNGETPTHVFICGADTDCCVLKTATDLFENKIMPLVLTDYCDSNGGPDSHQAGLRVMARLCGKKSIVEGKVLTTEDLDKIINARQY